MSCYGVKEFCTVYLEIILSSATPRILLLVILIKILWAQINLGDPMLNKLIKYLSRGTSWRLHYVNIH